MSQEPLVDTVTTAEFLERAASRKPTPGGGGIAALVGAAAASMAEMALNFTAGNKRFAAVDQQAREHLSLVTSQRRRLQELVAADARGYGAVAAALKMPRDNAQQKSARKSAMNAAMREALEPPLEMVRSMAQIGRIIEEIAEYANPNLIGDVGVAAALLPGAARAAVLNVWANVSALDALERAAVVKEVTETLDGLDRACSRVASKIEDELCPKEEPADS